MKKAFAWFTVFSILILQSCGSNEKVKSAVGGKIYGGEFKFMSAEKVDNLFTISSVDLYAQRLNAQIYEPLLKLDIESMKVIPSVAQSYTISPDAKTFTFKIRKGIMFHDDPCFGGSGRELTAYDVKFTLDLACSGLNINKMSYLLMNHILGAREFNSKSKTKMPEGGVEGIKVIDANTLEVKLSEPFIGFDKILTHSNLGIVAKEAVEQYGANIGKHPVGTGPFMLEQMNENGVVLVRNPKYWKKDEFGNQLPFLDKICMTYAKDKKSELLAFRNKEIDVVLEIPVEEIENILGSLRDAQAGKNVKHRVESKTGLSMNYIAFACESKEFSDPRIRRAFNMAVDKNSIVNQLLMGEGWSAEKGFVPVIENYDNTAVKGHVYDVSKAKMLMSEAGFTEGKGFPELEFYVNAIDGSASHKMCKGVAEQLKKNLNVNLTIKLCSMEERNNAVKTGRAKIWRSGWIADYPDAENFLSLFYSRNIKTNGDEVNAFRFKNAVYDQLLESAIRELDETKRNQFFVKCDQIIVDEAPVMPILTDEVMMMVNARVRDFTTNSMENLDFSNVYIKELR